MMMMLIMTTADPHAGNVMVCLPPHNMNEIIPGLLDFGMTVR